MRVVVVAGALIVAIALVVAVLGHKINQTNALPTPAGQVFAK